MRLVKGTTVLRVRGRRNARPCSRCGRTRNTHERRVTDDLCRDCYQADPHVWHPVRHAHAC